jgi:hypothetical protein
MAPVAFRPVAGPYTGSVVLAELVVGVPGGNALRRVKIGLWLPADVVRAWCCEPES